MTIVLDVPIRRLAYRGHDDPSLPTGVWWAAGTIVGDASGGTMQVRAEFKDEGAPVSGEMWNLEEFTAFISDVTALGGFITSPGLTPSRDNPGADRIWRIQFQSNGSLSGAIGTDRPKLPIFLGSVRGGADTVAVLALGLNNLTVTDSLSVTMMGYTWGPRSLLAEGGPQRPPRSVFGEGG